MKKTTLLVLLIIFGELRFLYAANINVKFNRGSDNKWSAAAEVAFNRAAEHWADVLTPNHEIRIHVYMHSLYVFHGSNDSSWFNVLGYAGADDYFTFNATGSNPKILLNTAYPSALVEKLSNQAIQGVAYHITIHMNSDVNWYYGENFSGIGPKQYDFTTVVLHELAHGLGFSSSSHFDSTLSAPVYNSTTPIIMDRYIYKNLGAVDMTSLPASGSSTTSFLTCNSLYFKGTEAGTQNGGNRPKLYAPSTWKQGSSISHWDLGYFGSLNNDKLMEPQAGFANTHFYRQVGSVTRGFMSDIGWDVAMNIEELQSENFVTFYPNPTTSKLNIKFEEDMGSIRVIARTGDGSVYYSKEHSESETTVSVQTWASGFYLLEITNLKNGITNYSKIIIIH
jgi:hypothetical protein